MSVMNFFPSLINIGKVLYRLPLNSFNRIHIKEYHRILFDKQDFIIKGNVCQHNLTFSCYHISSHKFKKNENSGGNEDTPKNLGDMASKYSVFEEKNAPIILDIYEERLKYLNQLEEEIQHNSFEGLNLERGVQGVYDIEDLVEVLKRENSEDLVVIQLPKHINYVDYICIVSGKSKRHMQAIAQFVRRVYKQKRHERDVIPIVEGENSTEWMALDLGNIALHIFSKDARPIYDLESLWSLGPEYDNEYNRKDPVADILEKHSVYLHDLEPAQ